METAEAIVIGGGIAGSFTAYFLSKRNINTILLEKCSHPCGATGLSGGIITRMMDSRMDRMLANETIQIFRGELRGLESIRQGYVSIENIRDAEYDYRKFRSIIPDLRLLDRGEAVNLFSYINIYDDEACLYSPSDITVEPDKLILELWDILRDNGVEILIAPGIDGFNLRDGEVKSISINGRDIGVEALILASGAWNKIHARRLGFSLDTWLIGIPLFKFNVDPIDLVGVWDEEYYSYWRPGEGGEWIGGVFDAYPIDDPDDGFMKPTREFEDNIMDAFKYRFRFKSWRLIDGWSAPVSISSNYKPIYGRVEGYSNLYIIDGLGGRGLMRGPAIARRLVEIITGERA